MIHDAKALSVACKVTRTAFNQRMAKLIEKRPSLAPQMKQNEDGSPARVWTARQAEQIKKAMKETPKRGRPSLKKEKQA